MRPHPPLSDERGGDSIWKMEYCLFVKKRKRRMEDKVCAYTPKLLSCTKNVCEWR